MFKAFVLFGLRRNLRGFGLLAKSLFKRGRLRVDNKYGAYFYLDPYEKIDSSIIRFGYFDDDVYKALVENINENDVLWDIGANIGLHAITIKKNFPLVSCLAFEPYPPNFTRLIENIKLNKLRIDCYNFALHDKLAIKRLYSCYNNAGQTGFSQLEHSYDTNTLIPAFSGDFVIKEFSLKKPNIIKMDTEGNELKVLSGFTNLFKSEELHTIVFECNEGLKEIEKFFMKRNFTVRRLSEAPNYIAKRIVR